MSSHIPSEKYETVQETVELISQYEIIAAADLNKVSSAMLQDMRKQLRGRHQFKVVKNTLMRISMEQAGKEGTHEFIDTVSGPNVFLFTNGFRMAGLEKIREAVQVSGSPKARKLLGLALREIKQH